MTSGFSIDVSPCSEQKIAQFRTHDLTTELSYVSTQQSGQVSMETKMIEKKCIELA
jgi:hypothetical protein